jgi:hypothetical protein
MSDKHYYKRVFLIVLQLLVVTTLCEGDTFKEDLYLKVLPDGGESKLPSLLTHFQFTTQRPIIQEGAG